MSTEYMLQLHKRLTEKTYGNPPRTLSSSTADAYMKTLFTLNDKKPFKNLSFLKKTEDILKKIGEYAESTQKTLLASISSVLSLEKEKPGYKKVYQFYYDKVANKTAETKKEDTTVMTETQKDNWLTWEEVVKRQKELKAEVDADVNQKAPLTPAQFHKLLSYLVLSLYVDIPPRRNADFLEMSVYKATAKDKVDDLPKDKNYLILSKGVPTQFVFNVYKTSKTHGTQHQNIPSALAEIITYFLKRVGNKAKEYKFLPIEKVNAITRLLNGVFGKNVGSSMLRHIFLSDRYGGVLEEQKGIAEQMAHTPSTQQTYIKTVPSMLEG